MPASEDKENLTLPTYIDIDTLPKGVEAGRFEGDKKSSHLVAAEKEVSAKKKTLSKRCSNGLVSPYTRTQRSVQLVMPKS